VSAYNQNTLSVFTADPVSGILRFTQLLSPSDGGFSPSVPFGMTITPNGEYLFLISHSAQKSGVLSLKRNKNGSLSYVSQVSNNDGTLLEPIFARSNDKFVFVTAEAAPYWTLFAVQDDGSLKSFVTVKLPEASPEGIDVADEYVYIAANGILVYKITDGSNVSLVQTVARNDPDLINPFSIALSDDDQYLYVPGRRSDSFSVYQRNSNGLLSPTPVQHFKNGVDNVQGLLEPIEVVEGGGFVFVTCYRSGVVVFQNVQGKLSYVGTTAGLGMYSGTVIGDYLYTVSYTQNALFVYSI